MSVVAELQDAQVRPAFRLQPVDESDQQDQHRRDTAKVGEPVKKPRNHAVGHGASRSVYR